MAMRLAFTTPWIAIGLIISSHALGGTPFDIEPDERLPEKPVSENNAKAAANDLAPEAQDVGARLGTALNPNNSSVSPQQVADVNRAGVQSTEMSAQVDDLVARNKVLKKDALALKTLLALEMLNASNMAAGAGPSAPATMEPSSSAPAAQGQTYVTPGFDPNPSSSSSSDFVASAPLKNDASLLSSIPEDQSVIVSPSGSSVIPPTTTFFAVGGPAPQSLEDSPNRGLLNSNESASSQKASVERSLASAAYPGNAYVGAASAPENASSNEEQEARAVLGNLADKLKRSPASKEGDPKSEKAALPLLAAKDDLMISAANGPTSVFEKKEDAPAGMWNRLADKLGDNLWPDARNRKPWQGVKAVVGALGLMQEPRGSALLAEEVLPAYLLLFLIGLSIPLSVFMVPAINRAVLRKFPQIERYLPTKTNLVGYLVESGPGHQTQLVCVKGPQGHLVWQIALRNKETQELHAVGIPKEDAVFTAQCLPTSLQNELGLGHGLERVRYLGKKGFEKTSEPLNPAFRPFPDKMGFLQENGFIRGSRQKAA